MAKSPKTLVTSKELIAMQIAFVSTDVFLNYPQFTQNLAFEASWMIPLISGILAVAVFLIVNWFIKSRFPNMDIVDIANATFGTAIGLAVALVFSLYFLCYTAVVMRLFMEQVILTVLPNTPIFLVGALFTAAAAYVVYMGFEAICRTAYLFMPILLFGIPILCLLTLNWWHPEFLIPLWGSGVPSVLKASVLYGSVYVNVLFVLLLYPQAKDPTKMRSIGVISILTADALLTGFLLVYNMVFPTIEAQQITFPFYQMARLIYLGRFFQRLDSLFIFLWVLMAVIRMAISLWASLYLMSRAFKWPTMRPAIPATALLAFALSLIPESAVQTALFTQRYLIPWGGVIVFGMPILITLLAVLFKPREKKGGLQSV